MTTPDSTLDLTQAAEGAPVDDQLAKAIAMDSCREMLRGIAVSSS